jgi:hypothetical protein
MPAAEVTGTQQTANVLAIVARIILYATVGPG